MGSVWAVRSCLRLCSGPAPFPSPRRSWCRTQEGDCIQAHMFRSPAASRSIRALGPFKWRFRLTPRQRCDDLAANQVGER
jgi:hypothetical protein